MATPAISDLLTPWTVDQVRALLLATLQAQPGGLIVTDWNSGGWERSIVELDAVALQDLATNLVPIIAASGFLDLALLYAPSWVPLIVQEVYGLSPNPAIATLGTMVLSCAASAGPYTFSPGQLWALGLGGNRYFNTTGGTLPSGGTLALQWQAETAAASYNDSYNTVTQLLTQFAGVTINNPPSTYSTPVLVGLGTGTIAASGTPVGPRSVNVRIDSAGQAGVATWSYSVDGGSYVSAGAAASAVVGYGITVTLSNGSISPSFIKDDVYTFTAPGGWVTQQGTDVESNTSLVARAKNRWPSLATLTGPSGAPVIGSPTLGFYDLLARQASSQVTQTLVVTDGTVNNRINIYIAGPAGQLPNAVVNQVQGYLNGKSFLTDKPVVASTVNRPVAYTATVTVAAAQLAAAQSALAAALTTYTNNSGLNPLLVVAEVIDRAMEIPGVGNITGVAINGVAADLQLPITPGAVETAQMGANTITWLTV